MDLRAAPLDALVARLRRPGPPLGAWVSAEDLCAAALPGVRFDGCDGLEHRRARLPRPMARRLLERGFGHADGQVVLIDGRPVFAAARAVRRLLARTTGAGVVGATATAAGIGAAVRPPARLETAHAAPTTAFTVAGSTDALEQDYARAFRRAGETAYSTSPAIRAAYHFPTATATALQLVRRVCGGLLSCNPQMVSTALALLRRMGVLSQEEQTSAELAYRVSHFIAVKVPLELREAFRREADTIAEFLERPPEEQERALATVGHWAAAQRREAEELAA
jgi:hypothetical protein